MELSYGLSDLLPAEGDIIKSQNAFATYSGGLWSGNLKYFVPGRGYMYQSHAAAGDSFVFPDFSLPTVTLMEFALLDNTAVALDGEVLSSGGWEVTERGFCYGTAFNPDITGSHVAVGSGTGYFTTDIEGLELGVNYFVRAYAVCKQGVVYSSSVSFSPIGFPEGSVESVFSVDASHVVYFSQGYNTSLGEQLRGVIKLATK